MNKKFAQISLAVGGSHYPTVNAHLQQQFGEAIVKQMLARIEHEIELAYNQNEPYAAATLEALAIQILDDFDMEIEEDWDAAAELQKIFDEFDIGGKNE